MPSFIPSELKTARLYGYLLGAVAPRPICFASTVSAKGKVNLAPFSFFNVFSAKPPIMIFSPSRRGRDNTLKHTLENVQEVKEVVINIVSYAMVQQMSLASTEYPKGVNEFVKAGFTEVASHTVTPPRVKEAPVQFECAVKDIIPLGTHGGAGNLVLCEVVKLHVAASVLDENEAIDPHKIDTVSRLGGNWYCRASRGLFEVPGPPRVPGMGVDALPHNIKNSKVLSGNNLGMLATIGALPTADKINTFVAGVRDTDSYVITSGSEAERHERAKQYLDKGRVTDAWCILLAKPLAGN